VRIVIAKRGEELGKLLALFGVEMPDDGAHGVTPAHLRGYKHLATLDRSIKGCRAGGLIGRKSRFKAHR
jgi:hypothetical protein